VPKVFLFFALFMPIYCVPYALIYWSSCVYFEPWTSLFTWN